MDARTKRNLLRTLGVPVALGLVLVGIWLGGHPQDLPSFMRGTFLVDNDTRLVNEAIDTVDKNYYRPVSKQTLVNASIEGMLASLHDPYSVYLSPGAFSGFDHSPSFSGIGVEVGSERRGLSVVRVFDSSPAERAGLVPGDVIVAVGKRSLAGLTIAASRTLIVGPPGTDVQLTVIHDGKRRSLEVTRETISEPVVASTTHVVHGHKLGAVYLATFSEGSAPQLREAVARLLARGARGIVLDLRANGGGLVSEAQAVASIFIPSGVIVTTRGRSQPTVVLRATGGAISTSIPMVVLVDRDTASAAEIVTAALQDHHRATIVGTHTFGKGVFQELEPLRGGAGIKITVGEYYTPNGRNLGGKGVSEGAGITPEVHLRDAIVDTPAGLEEALDVLSHEIR
jgi:carboxyl-terminal processing protease